MVDKLVFSKILVANRGEIAVRIMRSAQELGLKVVAIYEETDKDAFHIMRADEAVCIGSGPRKDYLNIDKIIAAAQKTGAQAIHPGYGFLAENPDFPEACTSAGLVFIGPPPEVIRNLGSKVIARKIAQATGVRVIPGSSAPAPRPSCALGMTTSTWKNACTGPGTWRSRSWLIPMATWSTWGPGTAPFNAATRNLSRLLPPAWPRL
jgi:biotin carboxylase